MGLEGVSEEGSIWGFDALLIGEVEKLPSIPHLPTKDAGRCGAPRVVSFFYWVGVVQVKLEAELGLPVPL